MKIRTKLITGYGIIFSIMLFMGLSSFYMRYTLAQKMEQLGGMAEEIDQVQSLSLELERLLMPANDYLISGRAAEEIEYTSRYKEVMEHLESLKNIKRDHVEIVDQLIEKIKILDRKARRIFAIPPSDIISSSNPGVELMYEMDLAGDQAYELLQQHSIEDRKILDELLIKARKALNVVDVAVILGLVISVVLTLFFIIYFEGVIRIPIEKLTRSMRGASHGRWNQVVIEDSGELSELANEFNNMVDRVSETYEDLEKKVDERTRELDELNKKLEEQATTDGLTGLFNHRYFYKLLKMEFERANRYKRNLAIVMIDIDFFKHYNDTHGHIQGDKVLAMVAKAIKSNSRKSDIVARYGGEEFAIIAPELDEKHMIELGERVRKGVATKKFKHQEMQPDGNLTVSVGIAFFPKHGKSVRDILIKADKALYKAKRQGKNRVVIA